MIRAVLRLLGWLLLAGALISVVVDGTRAIADGAFAFTSFGQTLFGVLGERFTLLQPAIERHLHPALWLYVALPLLVAPAALVLGGLGFLLLLVGRRRVRRAAHA